MNDRIFRVRRFFSCVACTHKLRRLRDRSMSAVTQRADVPYNERHVRYVPILLQKSKIERPRKSRESRFLNASIAATLCSEDTKVGGRFCVKRCGPSHRRAQNAPAALENFVHQPKKTFATKSANIGHSIRFPPLYSTRHRKCKESNGLTGSFEDRSWARKAII
jgi:hypothetical protein